MPTKDVNLTGEQIEASTIAEFYDRLNYLRHLNDGTTYISFAAPVPGMKIRPSDINNVETEILATKSALSFLASVTNLSTHTPSTISSGTLPTASKTVHPLEWQIGQLEKACYTNFTANRVSVNSTNFNANTSGSGCASFVAATTCAPFTPPGSCSTNKSANHTSDGTSTANCTSNWGSVRITNHSPQNSPNHSHHSTFRSGYFSTYRQYVNTSFHSGHGCNTWGSNYSPKQKTFHKTFNGTQRASDGTSFSANFGTHFVGRNSSVKVSVNTAQFVTQSTGASANSSHNITFNATNRAVNNAENCPSHSVQCAVDWTTFNVSPF